MNNPTETMGDIIAKLERDLKSAMEEIDRQSFARHGLERENAALRAKIADYENGWKACMDDNAEEQHCTCVPSLKIRVRELTAMLTRVEYNGPADDAYKCQICRCVTALHHKPDCELDLLLKGADDAPVTKTV